MPCPTVGIESNVTGLSYAQETCRSILPGDVDNPAPEIGMTTEWHQLEPNSYSGFGAEVTTVARNPIVQDRQNRRGVITGVSANGSFATDVTSDNLTDLFQGLFYADARETPTTQPVSVLNADEPITAVDNGTSQFQAAAGLDAFPVGSLVAADRFTNVANNGLFEVTTSGATALTVAGTLVDETPPSDAVLRLAGYACGAASIAVLSGGAAIQLTAVGAPDFTALDNLIPGSWVYVGGDDVGNAFVNNGGFGRISDRTATTLTFDDVSWDAVDETATGLDVYLFVGTLIRNEEDLGLVKRRTYQLERSLGQDANGTQSEYLIGAAFDGLTMNLQTQDKITAELSFVGSDTEYRDGTEGIKPGTRIGSLEQGAINTSSDVARIKISINSDPLANKTALFGYVTDGTISVNNNVTAQNAIGAIGAVDLASGNFVATGEVTAYFDTIGGPKAVRENTRAGLSALIATQSNRGFVFDIPEITLGNGIVTIESDQPVTLPLSATGSKSVYGHSMAYVNFAWLPTVAATIEAA